MDTIGFHGRSKARDIVSKPSKTGPENVGAPDCEGYRLIPLFNVQQKIEFAISAAIWFGTLVLFWSWWLEPSHIINPASFVLVTAVLIWLTFLPLYFLTIFFGARKPAGDLSVPEKSRVAMVVTKTPSEPFSLVAETLTAMLAQDGPHDTWLADEAPTTETLAWCAAHNVYVSSRYGHKAYHNAKWPRRTRCKEGNLAFFYDHYGYSHYDFVSQLDADHVPEKTYLREIMRPFADRNVGYVSAPSICDRNASKSWSARSRLFVEASLHGSLQAGYNNGWSPLCIGSHYAVRTVALKEIGGLGPELAEDHSTTLMMAAKGWHGVHAFDAIAHGEGPRTFADLVTQEFQWSRSLVTILLQYSPIYIPKLPPRLKFQFLFSQLWYPLFSIFMAIMFAMPIFALVSGKNFVNVAYPDFFLHFLPLSIVLILMAVRWRAWGSYRPVDAKILSWEGFLFLFARWPWSLAGTFAAIHDSIRGSFVDFRVTPKGSNSIGPLPIRVFLPYAVLSIASVLPALVFSDVGRARGFYIFAIFNATLYATLLLVIAAKHRRENHLSISPHRRTVAAPVLFAILLFGLPAAAAVNRGVNGLQALTWNNGHFVVFREIYGIAGAGQDGFHIKKLKFSPHWRSEDGLEELPR